MKKQDYIPSNDVKLLEWAESLIEYAEGNAERWKVMPPNDAMLSLADVYSECLRKTQSPNRGKIDTLEKNEARKALVQGFRSYVQGFLAKNPYVSNVDRERMGLTVYDTIPTPVAEPAGQAEAVISYPGRTQLQLHIQHVEGTPLDLKADYGYRIYYDLRTAGAEPPASGKHLRESRFTRQRKALFSFEPEDSGKTAFFSIRYENSKGQTGPWGPLFSAIVP